MCALRQLDLSVPTHVHSTYVDIYHVSDRRDHILIRALGTVLFIRVTILLTEAALSPVYGLLLLEAIHTVATGHALWYYVCEANTYEEKELGSLGWPEALIPLIAGVGAFSLHVG